MSKQKSHTPRSLCKSLRQMVNISATMHYQQNLSYEDRRFMYDIYIKCHRIQCELVKEHNLDIKNDFRLKEEKLDEK